MCVNALSGKLVQVFSNVTIAHMDTRGSFLQQNPRDLMYFAHQWILRGIKRTC